MFKRKRLNPNQDLGERVLKRKRLNNSMETRSQQENHGGGGILVDTQSN